jgi:hypothetical protein
MWYLRHIAGSSRFSWTRRARISNMTSPMRRLRPLRRRRGDGIDARAPMTTLPRRRSGRPAVLLALVAAAASVAARADEVDELQALRDEVRAEREALAKERAALEEQRRRVDEALAQLEAAQAAPSGAAPLPGVSQEGTRAQLDVYGFIQVDGTYDFDRVDPEWAASLRPSKIPVHCPADAGCGNDGETSVSVRQSRLGVRGLLPTPVGDLRTRFEFDLYGVGDDAGETTFRLRHAWGELGSFGAGQTSSLFMDPDVFPNTIEYWGPVGMVFLRNPQIRWTPFATDEFRAAVAVESPAAAVDSGKVGQIELVDQLGGFDGWNRIPDFTAHLRAQGEWGHVQLGGILRSVGFEIRTLDGNGPDGHEWGYGGNLSGSVRLFENDQILWQVAGGRGFANYMNDGGADIAPASSSPTRPGAETVPLLGWLLYYNRQWNERWTSSIGFSEHRQFPTSGQEPGAFQLGQYGSVNVLFHPIPQMFVGPEFLWGRRLDEGGQDGTDSRVQVSFHYDFSASIFGPAR